MDFGEVGPDLPKALNQRSPIGQPVGVVVADDLAGLLDDAVDAEQRDQRAQRLVNPLGDGRPRVHHGIVVGPVGGEAGGPGDALDLQVAVDRHIRGQVAVLTGGHQRDDVVDLHDEVDRLLAHLVVEAVGQPLPPYCQRRHILGVDESLAEAGGQPVEAVAFLAVQPGVHVGRHEGVHDGLDVGDAVEPHHDESHESPYRRSATAQQDRQRDRQDHSQQAGAPKHADCPE